MKTRYTIKHWIRFDISILTIAMAFIFIVSGSTAVNISELFEEVTLLERLEPPKTLDYNDSDVQKYWMNELEITQSDSDEPSIENSLGFHAYINVNEMPEKIIPIPIAINVYPNVLMLTAFCSSAEPSNLSNASIIQSCFVSLIVKIDVTLR